MSVWTYSKEIRDKLLAFEVHCYRRILRVSWTERKTNREICDKLGIERDLLQRAMLKHLHWLPIEQRIKFKLATLTHNTLCSIQPAYLHSLLNYHTPTRSLRSANANLLSVPRVRTTFQPLHPAVFVLQPPQSVTHSHLTFATLPLPILSVAFLKLTASSRPSAPPSSSPKCLRFGHWRTLCTVNIHLLTYLLI